MTNNKNLLQTCNKDHTSLFKIYKDKNESKNTYLTTTINIQFNFTLQTIIPCCVATITTIRSL